MKDVYEQEVSDDSDDEGNGGRRRISREDDESIDDDASEVGWTEEDEATFGKLFRSKAVEEEADEQGDDNFEEPGEGEMLLSDLLPQATLRNTADASAVDVSLSVEDGDEEMGADEDDTHDQLIQAVEKFSKIDTDSTKQTKRNGNKAFVQSFADSPFSSLAGSGAISMETLFGALSDSTTGLSAAKNKLIEMNKSMKAPTQVDKVVSERLERGMLYEETKTEMDKWKELVRENRHTKSLDLTNDVFVNPSYRDLVRKFEPMTDMEKEIQMVLVRNLASEEEVAKREEEALKARKDSEEELMLRQAELGKVRALMFYEQIKRHRINKIKSKLYRKIRKKQQSRREDVAEPEEGDEEGRESEEYKRVRERMDLRHKNTGKWAHMALTHGKADKSLRYGIV